MADSPSYWTPIPACVRYDAEIPPGARLLWGDIASASDSGGECRLCNAELGSPYGLTEVTISRLITSLVERGHLRIHVDGRGRRVLVALVKAQGELALGAEPKRRAGGERAAMEVYDAYPRKVGRKAALAKIAVALREIDAQTLLKRTRAYADIVIERGIETRFIPHPATWYGQGRYDDEDVVARCEAAVTAHGQNGSEPHRPAVQSKRAAAGCKSWKEIEREL